MPLLCMCPSFQAACKVDLMLILTSNFLYGPYAGELTMGMANPGNSSGRPGDVSDCQVSNDGADWKARSWLDTSYSSFLLHERDEEAKKQIALVLMRK